MCTFSVSHHYIKIMNISMSSTDFVISLFNPSFPTLLLPTLSPGSIFVVLCVCVLLLLQIISHFVEAYMNGSIYFILPFVWLLSLSMIILKFIHSVTYINNSSFLFLSSITLNVLRKTVSMTLVKMVNQILFRTIRIDIEITAMGFCSRRERLSSTPNRRKVDIYSQGANRLSVDGQLI